MIYDQSTNTLLADKTDMEHWGFDSDLFDGDLFLNGIDAPGSRDSSVIVVIFKGFGHFDSEITNNQPPGSPSGAEPLDKSKRSE